MSGLSRKLAVAQELGDVLAPVIATIVGPGHEASAEVRLLTIDPLVVRMEMDVDGKDKFDVDVELDVVDGGRLVALRYRRVVDLESPSSN